MHFQRNSDRGSSTVFQVVILSCAFAAKDLAVTLAQPCRRRDRKYYSVGILRSSSARSCSSSMVARARLGINKPPWLFLWPRRIKFLVSLGFWNSPQANPLWKSAHENSRESSPRSSVVGE